VLRDENLLNRKTPGRKIEIDNSVALQRSPVDEAIAVKDRLMLEK
jgi:hypothetical protein